MQSCSCSKVKQMKFLLSGLSSCERGLQLMSISICDVSGLHKIALFACIDDLHPNQQFSHVGVIFCLLGLNHY